MASKSPTYAKHENRKHSNDGGVERINFVVTKTDREHSAHNLIDRVWLDLFQAKQKKAKQVNITQLQQMLNSHPMDAQFVKHD
jgi:hypothetical protein